jgi:hypothetical protein
MFLLLAVIFGIAWLMGFAMFHVTGGAIHLLLLVAIAAIIVHVVRARRTGWGDEKMSGAPPLVR